jgi:hypothetical protein
MNIVLRPTVFAGFLLVFAACSSSSNATPASGGKKTCADLQKCCDSATEPTKTSCNAATAAKNEDLCATSYDKMCGGGGGSAGGDGGAGEGGVPEQAKTQCAASCAKQTASGCGPSDCTTNCEQSFTSANANGCSGEWSALTRCLAGAAYTCSGGSLSTSDCANEVAAFASCTK